MNITKKQIGKGAAEKNLSGQEFKCRECGHCCRGQTTVSLDDLDIKRLTAFKRMSFEELSERYLRTTGNVVQMKIVDGHCIFYNHGCTIHSVKPWRCSQWPLHPSILTDKANFEAISTSCPGIKKEMGHEEFCRRFSKFLSNKSNGV